MIQRRPVAIRAIIDHAEYIGQNSPASAERFLNATERTFRQLEERPGLGHRYLSSNRRLAGVRVWSIKGFPNHLIFYRPINSGIEILHLLHGARDIPSVLQDATEQGEI
jgi:toxin ParE1/3/4